MTETVVSYNGVTLRYVETEAMSSEVQYGPDGVVPIALRRSAVFAGVLTKTDEADLADEMLAARSVLLQPRKRLSIQFLKDGEYRDVEIVDPTGTGSGAPGTADALIDAGVGPNPISATITNIIGGRTAMVRFAVSWTRPMNELTMPAILSHRWEQRFAVDSTNYTTRVVRGAITLSQAATLDDLNDPDSYRLHVLPAPVRGFQRAQIDFTVSQDGRTLAYECVDRERFRPPPAPAMDGDGVYTETVQGGMLSKSFSIRLVGSKYTHTADLVRAAYNAMRQRIDFSKEQVLVASMETPLFENAVRMSVQSIAVKPVGTKMLTDGFMAFTQLSDQDLTQEFVQPTAYGAALVKAAAQQIFSQTGDGDSAWDALAKAAVVRADDIPGATDSPDVPNDPEQTLTVRAAAVNPNVADLIVTAIENSTSIIADAQRGKNPYIVVTQSFTVPVDNAMVVLRPLSDTADQEVHQYGGPNVVERHEGMISRLGTPPELPDIRDLVFSGESVRRGVVARWGWSGDNPQPTAMGADPGSAAEVAPGKVYAARFWYELAIVDRPSIAGSVGAYNFEDLAVPGFGTFRVYSGRLVYPETPILAGFDSGDQQDTQSKPDGWRA